MTFHNTISGKHHTGRFQTVKYWPDGTVFVSVVDPGVGSNRKSVVIKTSSGHFIVTPDNGSLTHIKKILGIVEAREIDESVNRLPNSYESYTFHGRDIYAYTGARLQVGWIGYEDIGPSFDVNEIVELPINDPIKTSEGVTGYIDVLDVRFGSLWTNIPREMFKQLNISQWARRWYYYYEREQNHLQKYFRICQSFADVNLGETLVYVNSLDDGCSNQSGSFAKA